MLDENGFATYSTMPLISYIMFVSINMCQEIDAFKQCSSFYYMSIDLFSYNISIDLVKVWWTNLKTNQKWLILWYIIFKKLINKISMLNY